MRAARAHHDCRTQLPARVLSRSGARPVARWEPVRAYGVDSPGRVPVGAIFAMAQTPDGYLWLGTEFGLFRFVIGESGRSAVRNPRKIAAELLRNAFHHAQAKQVEVEIRYDDDQFRLRVRDDGKGMDAAVLSSHGLEGHYSLRLDERTSQTHTREACGVERS